MRLITYTLCALLACSPALAPAASYEQTLPTRGESPLPEDLKQMARDYNAAMRSKNLDLAVAYYAANYLHDGRTADKVRGYLDLLMFSGTSQFELKFTRFAAIDDQRAYIEAVIDVGWGGSDKKFDYQVVKENGQWKWLGNQMPAKP